MFIHFVLFEIKKKHLALYYRDCKLWAKAAGAARGFLACHTLIRSNENNQYASAYFWTHKTFHARFMKKHHDRLVGLSRCPVKVLGYYNFQTRHTLVKSTR
jgi:hypothetical protein